MARGALLLVLSHRALLSSFGHRFALCAHERGVCEKHYFSQRRPRPPCVYCKWAGNDNKRTIWMCKTCEVRAALRQRPNNHATLTDSSVLRAGN